MELVKQTNGLVLRLIVSHISPSSGPSSTLLPTGLDSFSARPEMLGRPPQPLTPRSLRAMPQIQQNLGELKRNHFCYMFPVKPQLTLLAIYFSKTGLFETLGKTKNQKTQLWNV